MRPPGRTPALIIALVLVLFSVVTSREAYQQLVEQRELARLGNSTSAGLVAGPTHISGQLHAPKTTLVQAPGSNVASIYFRLQTEQRCERNNESRWCVVDIQEQIIPFTLQDADGAVRTEVIHTPIVLAAPAWQHQQGHRRLREWRLEPGDFVDIIARAETQPLQLVIDAESRILKTENGGQAGTHFRKRGLLTLFFSIILLAFALLMLTAAFRWHRILIYCGLLSGILCGKLVLDGVNLTHSDLSAGLLAAEQRFAQVEAALTARLTELQRSSDLNWSQAQLAQLQALQDRRVNALLETLQTTLLTWQQQSQQWPAAWLGYEPPTRWHAFLTLPPPASTQVTTPSFSRWQMPLPLLLVIAIVITLVSGRAALSRVKLARTIENLPTTDIAGIQAGLNEVTAEVTLPAAAPMLTAPLSGEPCIWYDYRVMERADNGRRGQRQWRTVEHDCSQGPLQLADDTGRITLDLTGAEVSGARRQTHTRGALRRIEQRLDAGDRVYVLGTCTYDWEHQGQRRLERAEGQPLLIATQSERRLQFEQGFAGLAAMTLTFCALVGIGLILIWQSEHTTIAGILLSAAIPVCALSVISIIIHYNDLVFLRERVTRNEANVEVALQQRHDLIGRLMEVVQAGLTHERTLQADLARLRQLPDRSEFGLQQWDAALAQSERGMRALIEQYPQLQAITLIQSLMANLSEQDTGVASARASLNHAIEHYMTRKHQIPDVWLAKLGRFPNIVLWSNPARVTTSPNTQPTQQ